MGRFILDFFFRADLHQLLDAQGLELIDPLREAAARAVDLGLGEALLRGHHDALDPRFEG